MYDNNTFAGGWDMDSDSKDTTKCIVKGLHHHQILMIVALVITTGQNA